MLYDDLKELAKETPADEKTRILFLQRLEEGALTRDENPKTHFCVYFLPYNPLTQQVFFVHHKKSGFWISPGGHIDAGETLNEALNREIHEELGMKRFFSEPQKPFFLTTVTISKPDHPCDMHYDLWYLVPTDGRDFHVDPTEFFDAKWMAIDEAIEKTKDEANKKALRVVLSQHETQT